MTPVDEAVARVRACVVSVGNNFEDDKPVNCEHFGGKHNDFVPLTWGDLRALLSALELGRHLAKDALPGGETHPCVDEATLERMARAHDKEDAAQKGEPSPWDHFNCDAGEVSEADCADCRSFRIDRLACMLRAWEALSASTTDSERLDAPTDPRQPSETDDLTDRRGRAFPALLEALELILPLAKGYASANPVGSNRNYVENAEFVAHTFRRDLTPPPPTGEGGGL